MDDAETETEIPTASKKGQLQDIIKNTRLLIILDDTAINFLIKYWKW